jgi:hypothetical protein
VYTVMRYHNSNFTRNNACVYVGDIYDSYGTCMTSFAQSNYKQCWETPYMGFIYIELFTIIKGTLPTHTCEISYICGICFKLFAKEITLTTHIATHSAGIRYACTLCSRSGRGLTRHMDVHNTYYGEIQIPRMFDFHRWSITYIMYVNEVMYY